MGDERARRIRGLTADGRGDRDRPGRRRAGRHRQRDSASSRPVAVSGCSASSASSSEATTAARPHDHSRIIRRSYHTEHYVRLAAAAYDAWREVEAALRRAVRVGDRRARPLPRRRRDRRHDLHRRPCTPPACPSTSDRSRRAPALAGHRGGRRRRRPGTRPTPASSRPIASVPLLQRLATEPRRRPAGRRRVRELRPARRRVELIVEGLDVPVRAGTVVVAADAWTNELLASRRRAPADVLQEQVSYYDVAEPEPFAIGRLPVWIWMDEPSFYGFPFFGRAGVKIAQDCGGTEPSPAHPPVRARRRHPRPHRRLRPAVLRRSAGACGAHRDLPLHPHPRSRLRARPVPGQPRVLVAQGAAHGYKFAAWFGRTLAALAAGRPAGGRPGPLRLRPARARRQPTGA